MLQEFKVRNFKNFRDELHFSLQTQKSYEYNKQILNGDIIKGSLIVGDNASGKTNLGFAMLDITYHLTDKSKLPARWNHNFFNTDETVCFEYVFNFHGDILVYKYEKKEFDRVTREELTINGKRIIVNDFSALKVDLRGAENLNLSNIDRSISLVRYVHANTILDKQDNNCKVFQSFMQFVNGMLWFSSTEGNNYIGFSNVKGNLFEAIARDDNAVRELEKFLCDMGIEYRLVAKDEGEGKNIYCVMGGKEIKLSSMVSSGTRSLIFFFFWYLQVERVSFVYIDEFDAFYHTDLASAVISRVIELKDTQAVITSHNTDLLSNSLLRPDCIFKLKDNTIRPFSDLTEKALREAHNLQKMYKAGAFND